MTDSVTINKQCRACKSKSLTVFLDLGDQPPANAFILPSQIKSEISYPLKACVCEACQLVQLSHIVDLDTLFQGYVYFTSGAGATTPKHFTNYAVDIIDQYALTKDSFIVEIGSNDGLLLQAFRDQGAGKVLGIDPALNVAEHATKQGIETIAKPWSESVAEEIATSYGTADVIIGNNVVAHIDDHYDLFNGVKRLLKPEGVFIFEAPYLTDMFDILSYDTIYHEHLSCLSLRPIKRMVESLGLQVVEMETKQVQGLSMRVHISHKGKLKVSPHVMEFIRDEEQRGFDKISTYHDLAQRIQSRKSELLTILSELKEAGKTIAGYGAPAKGNTMLNFLHIGPEIIDYLTEELPLKIGKLSPGMHIPTKHIDDVRKSPPDYFLVLAWNYLESILEKEKGLREKGVKFIVPVGKEINIV